MVELSADEFAQRALELDLLTERQLQEVWRQVGTREMSGEEFRQQLLRRDLLTNFQAEKLVRGERYGFYYGKYKVLYMVGSGTFARVFRAVNKETGKVVAVKVLRARFSEDKAQADSFLREGELLATLRHPNIVPIYEVHSKGNLHYLVMDFIEGRNLREFIKVRKKFSPLDATRLVADVAAGLSYAFDRGVHHRDLKMSNVLVSSRGQAKLVDFGLAAADPDESGDEEGVTNPRTIDYAGLERATGVRKDDPRSDIYFLGCIYYHLLSGKPALQEARDRIQRLSKTRFESVEPLLQVDPTIPKFIAPVVYRAMDLNVESRYQHPNEMLTDLKTVLYRLEHPELEQQAAVDGDEKFTSPPPANQRVLMVVESNAELQNVFRERLKSVGYRVLVTQDPDRAVTRLVSDPKSADCAIFSTGALGESALDAFNRLGSDPATSHMPAVLLLDEPQVEWRDRAQLGDHRVVVAMPIKLREFRKTLAKLVGANSD